jgi:hypothetical protein
MRRLATIAPKFEKVRQEAEETDRRLKRFQATGNKNRLLSSQNRNHAAGAPPTKADARHVYGKALAVKTGRTLLA